MMDAPKVTPIKIGVGLIAALVVGLYLSGAVFLWLTRQPSHTATPLTLVRYWVYFGHEPKVRRTLGLSTVIGLASITGVAILVLWPHKPPLHGAARFATKAEVARAGLLGSRGIILGRLRKRYLMLPGQQSAEVEAPPRSGKGVGVVIPNLLNWPDSVIVSDIKGENWMRTAGYRARHGQAVHLFDPLSEEARSSRWNPLAYVAEHPYRMIDDLQRIASMLYSDTPGVDPFWTSSARTLFLGIGLYLFETPGATRTIGEILRQGMASDAEGFQKHWRRVIETCEREGYPLSQEAVQTLYDVIDLAGVTASSIRKTFTSRLDLWLNPMIDSATSGNDFDLRDLRTRPHSIYVRINPDNIVRLQPLLNLFFQQAIGLQTRQLPEENPRLTHQLLLVLDEFAALGRIPVIAESAAFLPGYNVRLLIVVQSHSQLVEKYGVESAKTIRKTLAARIVFAPKEFEDAETISRELGTYTVKQKSYTRGLWNPNRASSVSISEQPRRLMLPQEIKDMGNAQMLLFYEGLRPVLAQRIVYFKDRVFAQREYIPPPVPKLVLRTPARAMREESNPTSLTVPISDRNRTQSENTAPPVWRAVEDADLSALPHLSLEDFSLNFDAVRLPQGRALTDAEIQAAVDRFLSHALT